LSKSAVIPLIVTSTKRYSTLFTGQCQQIFREIAKPIVTA